MFRKYRELALSTKLITFGFLTAIFFALQTKLTDLPTAGVNTAMFAGVLIGFHAIATYPRFVKISLISLIQLAVLSFVSSAYSFFYITEDPASAATIFLSAFALLLTTSVIALYTTLVYSKGRITLTLIVSYLIINFFGLFLGLIINLPYISAVTISSFAGLLWVLIRSRKTSRKVSPELSEVRKEIYDTSIITPKIEKILAKENWEALQPEGYENFWVVNTGKQIILLAGVYFKNNIDKTKSGLTYNQLPVENILGEISEVATVISKEYKLPRNKTHFAVIDVNNRLSLPAKGYETFGLSARTDKTHITARVLISNIYGISSYNNKAKDEQVSNVWENFQKSIKP